MSDPNSAAKETASTETSSTGQDPQQTQQDAGAEQEQSASTSDSQGSDSQSPGGKRIRIGSQRYGLTPPAAKPPQAPPVRPTQATAPVMQPAAPSGAARPNEAELSGATAAAQTPPTSQAAPTQAVPPPLPPPDRLSEPEEGMEPPRFKPRGAIPSKQTPIPTQGQKVTPPNTRAKLSPEMEFELLEALGGMSVEEIIAPDAGASEIELEPETRARGSVIAVHRDNIFIDLGGRKQGVLPLRFFPEQLPEVGAVMDVMIGRFDAAEGLYELVMPGGAVAVEDWSQVSEGMTVEARITGHNKGGLECDVNKLRGFIPASQVSMYRVEDLSQFVDQKFNCIVTEVNPEKRNLVLSRRAVLEREKADAKENLLKELEVGQTREAIVRSLQSFGAFVDLGGVDGLIHISQLSWDRLKHASEALEVGQKVKVKIQKIDPDTGKIGLGFRDMLENPWDSAVQKYPVRSRVTGTVSRIMEFGVFVRLEPGIEGLVHISELSHKRVWRAADLVAEGQEVEVQILSVDRDQQRISLSLKALEARPTSTKKEDEEPPTEAEADPAPPPARKVPLKGGRASSSGGEQFGLKW